MIHSQDDFSTYENGKARLLIDLVEPNWKTPFCLG
jgi:hypothetical protein